MIHLRGYVPSPREIQELLAQPVEDDDSRGKAGGQPNVIKVRPFVFMCLLRIDFKVWQ